MWRADRPRAAGSASSINATSTFSARRRRWSKGDLRARSAMPDRAGVQDFTIRLNHRELLQGHARGAGVVRGQEGEALVALDKLDKIGRDGVSARSRAAASTRRGQQALEAVHRCERGVRDRGAVGASDAAASATGSERHAARRGARRRRRPRRSSRLPDGHLPAVAFWSIRRSRAACPTTPAR